jgi:hypothetical protein
VSPVPADLGSLPHSEKKYKEKKRNQKGAEEIQPYFPIFFPVSSFSPLSNQN